MKQNTTTQPVYRIREIGYSTYWSNEFGWVGREQADTFTEAQKQTLNLPIGGSWEVFDTEPKEEDKGGKYIGEAEVKYGNSPVANMHRHYVDFFINGRGIMRLYAEERNTPLEEEKATFAERLATAWNEHDTLKEENSKLSAQVKELAEVLSMTAQEKGREIYKVTVLQDALREAGRYFDKQHNPGLFAIKTKEKIYEALNITK